VTGWAAKPGQKNPARYRAYRAHAYVLWEYKVEETTIRFRTNQAALEASGEPKAFVPALSEDLGQTVHKVTFPPLCFFGVADGSIFLCVRELLAGPSGGA